MEFKNMLGYGQTWNLNINPKNTDIEQTLSDVWNFVVKYFEENDNTSDEEITYLCQKMSIYYFPEIFDKCDSVKAEIEKLEIPKIIKAVIEGRDTENKSIEYLTYLIILFSIFDYEGNENVCNCKTISDENSVFSHDDGNINYYFKNNSRFIVLMDEIYPEWDSWTISCDPTGWFKLNNSGHNLKECLKNGYVNISGTKYYLFPYKQKIIDFLYDFLSLSINDSSYEFSTEDARFKIKDIIPPVICLNLKIEQTLRAIADYIANRGSKVKTADLGDSEQNINIEFSIYEDDVVIKYINIVYAYGIKLFKNYVNKLKKNVKNTDELLKTEKVKKLFQKICGSTESSRFELGSSDSGIASKECISSYFSNYTGYSIDSKTIEINGPNLDLSKTNDSISTSRISTRYYETQQILKTIAAKNRIETPLQFFETEVIRKSGNIFNSLDADITFYETRVDEFCNFVSGNLVSKITYLLFNNYVKVNDNRESQYEESGNLKTPSSICLPSFEILRRYQYETNATLFSINGTSYTNYTDAYKNLSGLVYELLYKACTIAGQTAQNETTIQNINKDNVKFDEYIKSRFASESGYFTEEDFFYLRENNNLKKAPVNSFVDIEFRVPQYLNGEWRAVWLPVTAVRDYDKVDYDLSVNVDDLDNVSSEEASLHAGTYFNSMDIEDKGGTKEITLILKSANDLNLENIIFYSLAVDQKLFYKDNSDELDHLSQIMKDSESNFRVRFGYRDRVPDIDSNNKATITTSNEFDADFINRDKSFNDDNDRKYVKPVQTYPWTYFKITGIQSSINDGEDTYTLTGVSSGAYILNNLSLCGVQPNFAGKTDGMNDEYRGTPKNVIGKLTNWITRASCEGSKDIKNAKVVFLGDDDEENSEGTIITGFDGKDFQKQYKYKLRSGKIFKGGNIEGVENFFFDSTGSGILSAKNFSLNNNSKTYSIKEVLDNLVEWLPQRVYYIAKQENQTTAIYVPYEDIYKINNFFSEQPRKVEKMRYQIIESDAYIYEGAEPSNITDDMYHRVYFIRMYFEGPGVKNDNKLTESSYLRVYNYRSVQNQVIENINIDSNDAELGNLVSSVTLLGSATPMVFTFNRSNSEMSETIYSQPNGQGFSEDSFRADQNTGERVKDSGVTYDTYFNGPTEDNIKPYFALNNSKYVNIEDLKVDNTPTAVSNKLEEAARFFTSQLNKEYTGEMTIMGDPFYYFDSTVEAGKYEIFLQMNRVANRKTYAMIPSKYTGIYYITGIKHSIDENGKYTTTLSIVKRIFGTLDETKRKSVQ